MTVQTSKSQCEGISKKTGKRCTAPVVTGKTYCAGHAGLGVAASKEAAVEGQRLAAEGRREQAAVAKRSAADVYRAAARDNAELFVRTRLAVVKDKSATHAEREAAMRSIEDRGMGRPTEHVQTEDVTDKPLSELGMGDLIERMRRQVEAN